MTSKSGPLQRGRLQLEEEMLRAHSLFPHLYLPFLCPHLVALQGRSKERRREKEAGKFLDATV